MKVVHVLIWFVLLAGIQNTIAQKPQKDSLEKEKKDKDDPPPALPLLVRGPYLQCATSKSIMIRWRTDALCRSRVHMGTDTSKMNIIVTDSSLVTEHKVVVNGLESNTKYFYSIGEVKNKLQGDTGNYFYTLPVPGDTGMYRIAAFGDCGNNSLNQRSVRNQLLQYLGVNYLNAWILLGDNAYTDATDAEFQANFFNVYKDDMLKRYPLFPSPGNHDYHDKEFSAALAQNTHEVAYYHDFSMPASGESGGVPSGTPQYYSFDIGNIHFLSLDSYGKADGKRMADTTGPQVEWIKKDLEASRNAEWIVAYWHHPPYTMGSHNGDTEMELVDIREQFIPVLDRYGVDIVLGGHSHDYERSRPMYGYYGNDSAFNAKRYNISQGSGNSGSSSPSGPYVKNKLRERGTIYVVTGSSAKVSGIQKTYPHKAMFYSDATHVGVSLIEVHNNQLTFRWLCSDGVIRDEFTIVKK
jgi:hypothetical protein